MGSRGGLFCLGNGVLAKGTIFCCPQNRGSTSHPGMPSRRVPLCCDAALLPSRPLPDAEAGVHGGWHCLLGRAVLLEADMCRSTEATLVNGRDSPPPELCSALSPCFNIALPYASKVFETAGAGNVSFSQLPPFSSAWVIS